MLVWDDKQRQHPGNAMAMYVYDHLVFKQRAGRIRVNADGDADFFISTIVFFIFSFFLPFIVALPTNIIPDNYDDENDDDLSQHHPQLNYQKEKTFHFVQIFRNLLELFEKYNQFVLV